ncbi:CotH kinase family protein [candidate division KSB1 bacterium]|nr:CotH kinase family protein [candidate division KSB1 bacterium]
MKKTLKIIFAALLPLMSSVLYPVWAMPVVINEFLASSTGTPDSDWIELYNPQDSTVWLGGWYLTDNLEQPDQWQIPEATTIGPKAYLLIWADNLDSGLHMNFALSKSGEQIGLYDAQGVCIDSLTFAPQQTDISFGRYPDGGVWGAFFDPPTPGAANVGGVYEGILESPIFSQPSGFYSGIVQIELTGDPRASSLRYTLDGSVPTLQSPIYTAPVEIKTTSVIRAASFRRGFLTSPVITRTFLIDEITDLPVVSAVSDPPNLWEDEIGIYVEGTNGIPGYCSSTPKNWNQDWERPVNLEYLLPNGMPGFQLDAGMKIGGGCTRKYPQKTLAIYARSEYGAGKIEYAIFPDKNIDRYNNINLRNSGQDWYRILFRDGLVHTLVKNRMDIDWQAYQPALVFINGDYWGIHGIREKHNEHYIAANHGIDPDSIDIVAGDGVAKEGSAEHYTRLIDFIKSHDLSQETNYRHVANEMEIDEYLNYVITEIYCANIDWPAGNIKYWRQKGANHKWRWILFDVDLSFGAHSQGQYHSNTLAVATSSVQIYYANPPWSTLLLRSLLQNDEFRSRFIQRFAAHMNITFEPQRVVGIIDSLQAQIASEIPRHKSRWPASLSFGPTWEAQVDIAREFGQKRPDYVFDHLIEKFALQGTVRLQVKSNNPAGGNVYIEKVRVPSQGLSGRFFRDVSLTAQAVAAPGYRFVGWSGVSESQNDSIAVVLRWHGQLEAIFEPGCDSPYDGVVINEFLAQNSTINTDTHGDYDDWIELYNPTDRAIDIGGLWISDDLTKPAAWQIPATASDSTTIPAGGFLLLWADKEPEQGVLHVDIKLSVDGEQIGLFDGSDGEFIPIDTLTFGEQTRDVSFGCYPDGSKDWRHFMTPTPGFANIDPTTGVNSAGDAKIPRTTALFPNYPNPFNPSTTIRFNLADASPVRLSLYDIRGRQVSTLLQSFLEPGEHERRFDGTGLPSGVYFIQLETGRSLLRGKIVLIE